ncbi:hypothetical protein N7526_002202 [Penicillium atrosanguineum]|nr:hypothetical protein N7526_002202 [Penicillium atrosanguineum]
MQLTPSDIICCPPPLFHCFGLVLGFLSSFTHGSSIIFPSDNFDVHKVVSTIIAEHATVLLGVPTMYVSELEVLSKSDQRPQHLRTGLASGSAVSQGLMNELREKMGVQKMLIAYGMTETSPVTFITSIEDGDEKGTSTVGRVMPHTGAKVIGKDGVILGRGERGELCTSGFALQKGYWRNEEKTREVMRMDGDGILWMHTGDEALIDEDGEASVVGIKDERYGEVVGCFLKKADGSSRIPEAEVKQWVSEKLGRHKTPEHTFWIGDQKVGSDFPKTGSGKHQKHLMRDLGNRLVQRDVVRAKL